MGVNYDLVNVELIASLFGLWFFAWIFGFLSAHFLRVILDIFKRSNDD